MPVLSSPISYMLIFLTSQKSMLRPRYQAVWCPASDICMSKARRLHDYVSRMNCIKYPVSLLTQPWQFHPWPWLLWKPHSGAGLKYSICVFILTGRPPITFRVQFFQPPQRSSVLELSKKQGRVSESGKPGFELCFNYLVEIPCR